MLYSKICTGMFIIPHDEVGGVINFLVLASVPMKWNRKLKQVLL